MAEVILAVCGGLAISGALVIWLRWYRGKTKGP